MNNNRVMYDEITDHAKRMVWALEYRFPHKHIDFDIILKGGELRIVLIHDEIDPVELDKFFNDRAYFKML